MCSFSHLLWKFRHIRLQIHIHLRKNEEAGYGAKGPKSLLSSILVKNDFLYFCYGVPPPSLSPHVSILDFVPLYSVQFSLFLIEYLSTLHIKNVCTENMYRWTVFFSHSPSEASMYISLAISKWYSENTTYQYSIKCISCNKYTHTHTLTIRIQCACNIILLSMNVKHKTTKRRDGKGRGMKWRKLFHNCCGTPRKMCLMPKIK